MPQAPKRKRDRAATEAALLAAARARFTLGGYDATSVRDIARDAGVDPALIFRYFGSKERLFERAAQTVEDQRQAPPDGGPEDVPIRLLHAAMQQAAPGSAGGHPLAALLLSSGRPECRERLNAQLSNDYVHALEQLVDLPDRELRAELLTAWLLGITVARSLAHTPALSEACVEEISPYFERVAAVLLGTPAPAAAPSGHPAAP
ncbi:TetR family transcriptional regulator [Streptomyces sp. SA15]|uniref:TetR/AcrR family transcriptional regulator n=1 Tax=Streptomyces sp. SA15 TaxID=934019 RepID=UPI000BB0C47F|nr:TetR/AcrR family transcriptional regulator [Streptomyces sp. SA15]PAZ11526.1 TetR family transcriptional regulator [Streptomyces sp. SA15]